MRACLEYLSKSYNMAVTKHWRDVNSNNFDRNPPFMAVVAIVMVIFKFSLLVSRSGRSEAADVLQIFCCSLKHEKN